MTRPEELADLLRTWKPPAELTGSLPRRVRLSGQGVILAVAFAILVVVGVACGVGVASQARSEAAVQDQLRHQGISANAVITRLWRTSGRQSRFKVSYQFKYDGVIYGGESEPPHATWRELRTGDTLPIHFLPSAPGTSQPESWPNSPTPLWRAFLVGLLLPSLGLLLLSPVINQRKLLAEGRPAPAIVTKSYRARNRPLLDFEFPLPGGSVIQVKGTVTRNYPDAGNVICVIYDRENPRRNAPYPLLMVDSAKTGSSQPGRL